MDLTDKTVTSVGSKTLIGVTEYRMHYTIRNEQRPTAYIMLSEKLLKRSDFLIESVLWHEFAHAYCYCVDGKSDGHKSEWKRFRRKKFSYVIGDNLIKLIF